MTGTGSTAKDITRAFYESYTERDLDASWETYLAPGVVTHAMGDAYTRATWLDADKQLLPGFPDLTGTVLDQVAEGDKVATRFTLSGTHTGEFFGVPASGRFATLTGTAVDVVKNGRIVEHWADVDFGAFLQQLAS